MKTRREIIKSTGLAVMWTAPVIKTVSIPVHAMTSTASDIVFIRKQAGCSFILDLFASRYDITPLFIFDNRSTMPLDIDSVEIVVGLSDGTAEVTTNGEVITSEPFNPLSRPTTSNLPIKIDSGSRFAVRWQFDVSEDQLSSSCTNPETGVLLPNLPLTLVMQTSAGEVRVG